MQPKRSIFNITSCKWPSTSSVKSLTWFLWVIYELLFIFSSYQHVQHMTSQILLILIDFDSFLIVISFLYLHSERHTDFALEICNLPRITDFALKLRINSQSLSQSESSNFSHCVITHRMDARNTRDWQANGAMFQLNIVLCAINLSCDITNWTCAYLCLGSFP